MHIWNYRSSTFPYPRRFYQKKYICTDLGLEKQMYKDMRLSMYETQVYKMLPYWKSVQRNTVYVLYLRRLEWMDIQLLLKSWLPCYVLLALFEKGQLGKKWIRSREKSSLQVGLALHCRNKRVWESGRGQEISWLVLPVPRSKVSWA